MTLSLKKSCKKRRKDVKCNDFRSSSDESFDDDINIL